MDEIICPKCKTVIGILPMKEPEPITTVTVWFCGRVDIHNLPVFEYVEGNNLFAVGTYTFSGTPDIDRIIAETKLGKPDGALAVKVECTEKFKVEDTCSIWNGVYIITRDINITNGWRLCNDNGFDYKWISHLSDNQLESAITEYLEKQQEQEIQVGDVVINLKTGQPFVADVGKSVSVIWCTDMDGIVVPIPIDNLRKASPDEVLEWFTKEVNGNRYVAYKDRRGYIIITYDYGDDEKYDFYETTLNKIGVLMMHTFIKHHNITPIPYEWAQKLWGDKRPYPKGNE